MQIAVLNSCSTLKNVDVAFLVEAVSNQLVEFCQAWNLEPWAVSFYASAVGLPADDIFIAEYVDKLDVDGALAYHSVDALGRPYLRMLPPSDPLDATDLSHEVLETRGDETCDRWMKMPSGSEVAAEVCDPVQGDSYEVATVVIGGQPRQIKLSNYVLPGFFDAASTGPFDRLGKVLAPFGMSAGGYEAVIDQSGTETNVFAHLEMGSPIDWSTPLSGRHPLPKTVLDVGARISRRLRGRRAA